MMPRLSSPFFLFAAVASFFVFVGVAFMFVELKPATVKSVDFDQQVEYFMEGVVTVQTDEFGQRLYEMRTPTITHFADNHSEIDRPEFVLYSGLMPTWFIWADKGTLYHDVQVVVLEDNVKAESLTPHETPTKISTQTLFYQIKSGIAETEGAAIVTQGENILKSFGIRVYLNDHKIELLRNVKGYYTL